MRSLAHIINPVQAPPSSDLHVAQPITFETMRRAREYARGIVQVRQLTTQYPEDRPVVPKDFEMTDDLERSVMDVAEFQRHRKLPLLKDILDRLYEASDGAEYLIYSNVDISLMPHFYSAVSRLIEEGYDAFVINRRTIGLEHNRVDDIHLMYAEAGEKHPGSDCFVFARVHYPKYFLGNVCLGTPGIGRALLLNLACHAQRFKEFRDLHLTFHLGNDQVWTSEEYADYRRFGRGEMYRVLLGLEDRLGRLEDIEGVAPYASWVRTLVARSSGETGGAVRRVISMATRLWSLLRKGRLPRG